MGEEKFTEFCVDVLKEEGYSPKIEEDGTVVFKCGESHLYFWRDKDAPDFMRLVHLCNCECEDETERKKLFSTATEINRIRKILKTSALGELGEEVVEFSVEALVDSREQFKLHLQYWIDLLMSTPRTFVERLKANLKE